MKISAKILIFLIVTFIGMIKGQTLPFKDNLKWGIKENNKILIKPVYDTIFPSKCGKIFVIAFAAPVEVGIMLIAAALALLKSL